VAANAEAPAEVDAEMENAYCTNAGNAAVMLRKFVGA
jgi:hypothetical protein